MKAPLYRRFNDAVIELGVAQLSRRSKVPVDVIEAIMRGSHAAALKERDRLAAALHEPKGDLFRLDDALEAALADVEAQGLSRHSSTASKVIDR